MYATTFIPRLILLLLPFQEISPPKDFVILKPAVLIISSLLIAGLSQLLPETYLLKLIENFTDLENESRQILKLSWQEK